MKHVVIFARRPQLGRVKTRLAADIGPIETLRFYRATLNTVSRRLVAGGGWSTWIASFDFDGDPGDPNCPDPVSYTHLTLPTILRV